jgi:Zn-dependent peptidase ImmA (M78 family)
MIGCHATYQNRSQTRDWAARQSNTLGAAVLMPEDTLRRCMAVFGLGNWLDMLSSVCRPKEYRSFCKIAAHLGVSKKALAIRMKQLGLLGEEYLANPTAPIDVWVDDDRDF